MEILSITTRVGASLTGLTTREFSEHELLSPSLTHKVKTYSPNRFESGTISGVDAILPSHSISISSELISREKLSSLKLLSMSDINPLL